jgi:hypothetical protein
MQAQIDQDAGLVSYATVSDEPARVIDCGRCGFGCRGRACYAGGDRIAGVPEPLHDRRPSHLNHLLRMIRTPGFFWSPRFRIWTSTYH